MVTPFTEAGEIDWPRVDGVNVRVRVSRPALTEWYILNGCKGIFSVCQSSEMYNVMHIDPGLHH